MTRRGLLRAGLGAAAALAVPVRWSDPLERSQRRIAAVAKEQREETVRLLTDHHRMLSKVFAVSFATGGVAAIGKATVEEATR